MQRKQFEEVLDDCISAYLAGRRSVEESLSLYPSVARELEPLLRAAADTHEALQQFSPPVAVQERIRQNILRAANERAAARALTSEIDLAPRATRSWGLALVVSAGMAVLAVTAVTGLLAAGTFSSGEPESSRSAVSAVETPGLSDHITNARRQLEVLQQKARSGQAITSADIATLVGTTRRLAETAEPSQLGASDQRELETILEGQLNLLRDLNKDTTRSGSQIDDALAATVTTAVALGIPLAQPSPAGGPLPSASASPTSTPVASPAPSPSPSVSPSLTPTPAPVTPPAN